MDLPPTRVRFQQRFAGAVLDDLVLDGEDPRGGLRTVEHQIKRKLAPIPSNEDFVEIITRCLTAIDADAAAVDEGRRRFGIASAASTALADLARVTVVARSHDTPDGFLDVIRETARREVRDRLDALRAVVVTVLASVRGDITRPLDDATADRATWRVACALHVWQVDAEPVGRDVLETCDRLADLLPAGADPAALFRTLTDAARGWAPQAGSVSLGMLRTHLEQQGVALNAVPARRAAFETLLTASRNLLDTAAAQLGRRLHLPRVTLRAHAADAVVEHPIVVLCGRAGVGKSVLGRLVAADLEETGATVAAIGLSGRTGALADCEADIGVRIADALAGAPIGDLRVLLIDGAEQALTDGAVLLTALLAAIPTGVGSSPPWHLVLTAREEAVGTLARIVEDRTGTAPCKIVVDELTDEEVRQILETFPTLMPLGRHARSRALLLRRPYLVELLVRAVEQRDLPREVVGEEDLVDVVTERLVRRDDGGLPGRGAPDARADVYLSLADAAIMNALPARLDGTDAEARAGLASDDVIRRTRASWRFAHDILSDYAVASRLMEHDGDQLLAHAPAPRRLLRGPAEDAAATLRRAGRQPAASRVVADVACR